MGKSCPCARTVRRSPSEKTRDRRIAQESTTGHRPYQFYRRDDEREGKVLFIDKVVPHFPPFSLVRTSSNL